MLYLVLAFIGGGIAEALVAFAAHHFHRKPVKIEIVDPKLVVKPKPLTQQERRALLTDEERVVLEKFEPEMRMARNVSNLMRLHQDADALEEKLLDLERSGRKPFKRSAGQG